MATTDLLVWVDCEMTGLDLINDELIEVAALVTDANLNVLGEGVDLVIKPSNRALEQMGDFVRGMHEASGLLSLLDSGLSMAEAEQRVLDYVRTFVAEPAKAPLAGNTIGTDRAFLARDMPTFERHVHYRSVDVSSIKELVRRWYPRVYYQAPAKAGNHRALADVEESIVELRYYREAVFVPLPGQHHVERDRGSHSGLADWGGSQPELITPANPCPVHFTLRSVVQEHARTARMVGVAQLVEHLVVVQDVAGSSPVTHPRGVSVEIVGLPGDARTPRG
jgi:oligoribonuclease